MTPLTLGTHLESVVPADAVDQLALSGEGALPAMLVLFQLPQPSQDLNAVADAADLVQLLTLLLDQSDLPADEIQQVLMVIEEVFEVDLVVELNHRTLLEEQRTEDGCDWLENSRE